ncbi:MAG: N-acetyltransferase family protein [Chloroflexota bacterium]
MQIVIEAMTAADWHAVAAIYAEGIAGGNATFETAVPPWETWDAGHHASCRLVAQTAAGIVGWAALSPVSKRPVYRGVAEVSVYVAGAAQGHGVGKALLTALINCAETAGFWTLQASIFPENEASLAIHAGCDFRQLGRRERVAQHHGVWRDTVLLERRSQIVGV